MTATRWLGTFLVAAFALVACADQQTGEMESETGEMEPAPEMEAATPDPDNPDLAVWNTDADARLEQAEFDAWLAEQDFFGQWNTDGAPGLTVEEFGAGIFGVLDANDDGTVSATEWEDAGSGWTGDATLSAWDTNGDGALDPGELAGGIQGGDRWSQWDQDGSGVLEEGEFNQAVFGAWDANGDGYVDESEWRANFDLW